MSAQVTGRLSWVAKALVAIAALERGQADDVVTELLFGSESCVAFSSVGNRLEMGYDADPESVPGLLLELASGLRPALPTPDSFPTEPLTPHQKWLELLQDIGSHASILSSPIHPDGRDGLQVLSIARAEKIAKITVGDGNRRETIPVPLDDGLLVVGINDDLVTAFREKSGSP